MYPIVPPPTSDIGAWSIPRRLQRWLDVNPISKLTRTQAFITLPSFSVGVNWLGYSDIVASFNYEGPNNFSLVGFNVEPSPAPNYLLCIMWKDSSGKVYRYKLWSGVGEVIYGDIPLYEGQKIAKNFRFEIWSTNTGAVTQTAPISIYTSVLGKFDYRYGSDSVLVNSDGQNTSFADNAVVANFIPPTGLSAAWLANVGATLPGGLLTTWVDIQSGHTLVSASNNIIQSDPNSLTFTAASQTALTASVPTNNVYLLLKLNSTTNSVPLYFRTPAGGGVLVWTITTDGSYNIKLDNNNFTATVSATNNTWVIVEIQLNVGSNDILNVYNAATSVLLGTASVATTGSGTTTAYISNQAAVNNTYEIGAQLFYSSIQSSIDRTATLAYLAYYLSGITQTFYTLPLTFPANSTPQSN